MHPVQYHLSWSLVSMTFARHLGLGMRGMKQTKQKLAKRPKSFLLSIVSGQSSKYKTCHGYVRRILLNFPPTSHYHFQQDTQPSHLHMTQQNPRQIIQLQRQQRHQQKSQQGTQHQHQHLRQPRFLRRTQLPIPVARRQQVQHLVQPLCQLQTQVLSLRLVQLQVQHMLPPHLQQRARHYPPRRHPQ